MAEEQKNFFGLNEWEVELREWATDTIYIRALERIL